MVQILNININIQDQTKMINNDFVALNEFRSDGRKSTELRNTSISLGVKANADGSCLLKQGLTQVLSVVRGPYQRPNPNDNLLKIQYTVAPFSSLQKKRSKYDRDFSVYTQNIRKSFQGIILGDTYSKSQIEITVTVIENQGSAKSAVMNCISISLANAGISIRDLMVACTLGHLNNMVVVDPNEEQEYDLQNQLVISYINGVKKVDCVDLKNGKIMQDQLKVLYGIGVTSCQVLYRRMRKSLVQFSQKKLIVF